MSEYAGVEKPLLFPTLGEVTLGIFRETYANLQQVEAEPGSLEQLEKTEEYKAARLVIEKLITPLLDDPIEALAQARSEAVMEELKPLFQAVADIMTNDVDYTLYHDRQQQLLEGIVVGRRIQLTWPDSMTIIANCVGAYASAGMLLIDFPTFLDDGRSGRGTMTKKEEQSVYMTESDEYERILVVSQLKFLPHEIK